MITIACLPLLASNRPIHAKPQPRGALSDDARPTDCPTPLRNLTLGRKRADWTEQELEHLKNCRRCRTIQLEIFRQRQGAIRGLIADDDPAALEGLAAWLHPLGAELTTVAQSDAVISHANAARERNQPFDFFILDNRMQGNEAAGIEAGRMLRRGGYPQSPMLVVTAWESQLGLQQRCRDEQIALLSKRDAKYRLLDQVALQLLGVMQDDYLAG